MRVTPWSKKHKLVTRAAHGGVKHSLSNSYAQPLTSRELLELTRARGDFELARAFTDHALGYTPNGGSHDLRQEIAQLYVSDRISADNILVFAGAQVALLHAAVALAADCHSIVFTPGYQSTVECPRMAGGTVTHIPRSAKDGWQIPLDALRRAIRPGETKYIVINEPFNPAGTLMGRVQQEELVSIARAHDIRIMSDEVYRLLEHDPRDRLPAMCDLYEQGISCVTMSKPWGGCGITIGWLAFQDLRIKQNIVDVQYFGTACPSRASEIQALMVLRASDAILEKNMRIIRHNLELLDGFMTRYPLLFEWVRPVAGAIAFLKFTGPLTSEQLGAQLAEAGISIKPAYCFAGGDVHEGVDYFRVGFGEVKMPKALAALEEFVRVNEREWMAEMSRQRGSVGGQSRL
jgi:aspartate/methionine/tyrosine aminotransferase